LPPPLVLDEAALSGAEEAQENLQLRSVATLPRFANPGR
jgi:hypothetical protein